MERRNIEKFFTSFDQIEAISIHGYNVDRQAIYWNIACEELYGYSASEALGQQLEDLTIPEPRRKETIEKINNFIKKSTSIPPTQQTLRRADGAPVEVFSSQCLLEDNNHEPILIRIDVDVSNLHPVKPKHPNTEIFLHSIFEASSDFFFLMDENCRVLDYRAKKDNDFNVSCENFLGKKIQDILPRTLGQQFFDNAQTVNKTGESVTFEFGFKVTSGSKKYSVQLTQLPDDRSLIILARDVTVQKIAETAKDESEVMYRQMFEKNRAIKLIIDPADGSLHEANAAAVDFYGYSKEELCSLKITDINTLSHLEVMREMDLAEKEERLFFNFRHRLKSGEIRDVEVNSGPVDYAGKNFLYSIINDITERKRAEAIVAYQAHYDSLTNLPNRFLSLDRLTHILTGAKREKENIAVIFLDLDDFKKINDSLGHESGDALLIEASQRLVDTLRSGDTIGRLGGDEFIILLGGLVQGGDVTQTVENLLEQFRKPFSINGQDLILTASMGIAIYPEDGENSSTLLRHSDIAMYKAKENGRNTYSFYTESMNQAASQRLSLEAQMHGALERNEFTVNFQPQIDVKTGKVISAEALLRWSNTELGHVSPVDFIPVAEQTGLIVPIGKFVIETSLAMLSKIHGEGFTDFRMAVNLSPRQFRDAELVSFITSSMTKAGLDTQFLELEITEGLLLTGHSFVDRALKELNSIGITLSMDDFGTGYSSLSYLRQYPFDILKIDRSFISGIAENSEDLELVIATVAMAHALGLKVVAEGVEDQSQLQILSQINCDLAQGYLFGKAMPEVDFFAFLKSF
ncbi:MAG: diguanylate cyclase (GGDEF)-like protein/PAS domain S-box-containing protein [Gammaproteobacteria bacterium]